MEKKCITQIIKEINWSYNIQWMIRELMFLLFMWLCKMKNIICRHLVAYSNGIYSLLFTCEEQMVVQFNFVVGSVLEGRLDLTDG